MMEAEQHNEAHEEQMEEEGNGEVRLPFYLFYLSVCLLRNSYLFLTAVFCDCHLTLVLSAPCVSLHFLFIISTTTIYTHSPSLHTTDLQLLQCTTDNNNNNNNKILFSADRRLVHVLGSLAGARHCFE